MKTRITEQDYIKANKKVSRELEIATYGKQLSMCGSVSHKSKKVYDRKKMKSITLNNF